jgi:hypothetical protein
MKLIKGLPPVEEMPLTFSTERFDEASSYRLLGEVLDKAKEVISVVTEAYKEEWTKNPSTSVRAVLGHWLVSAFRHFRAIITLCEEQDLSMVADVHYRQIFELYLQVRYFTSLDDEIKEKCAEKISTIGCMDFLDKLSALKDHEQIKAAYVEVSEKLEKHDKEIVEEIIAERKKGKYTWFGSSYAKLAQTVSQPGEDLKSVYQIISSDVHGSWNLALDVRNPKPGHLDFRGYPDNATLYLRAAETVHQVTGRYMFLWNEIAESVGAQKVYFVA